MAVSGLAASETFHSTTNQLTHKGLEQEKLQNLWCSAFGALTPVFCILAARLKKPAYGMNDLRRWWNILDKARRCYGMVPTRADRCCYGLYALQSRKRAWEHWVQGAITQQNGTKDIFTESRERSEMEAAFEKTLDPIAGSPATGKSVARIINLFVDDLFRTSGNDMEQRFLTRPGKDFQVGPEDWNDVAPKEQRIRSTQDPTNGPYIVVSQDKATDELEGISAERNTKEDLHCTPSLQTMYRSSSRDR